MSNKLTPLTPTISAIKLPDGATEPQISYKRNALVYTDADGEWQWIFLENEFRWHILGPVSELTPEQKAEIVGIEWLDLPKMKDFGAYDDYDAEGHLNAAGWNEPDGEANYLEAVKKFIEEIEQRFTTLLQSKRVYTVNPYGDFEGKRININAFNGAGGFINGELLTMSGYVKKFDEAQPYVGNWILIKKEV